MSETDKSEEVEYAALQSSIASVERIIRSSPTPNFFLTTFLENAKSRADGLEQKIKDTEAKETRTKQEEISFAALRHDADKEKALSESERRTYDGFLGKEFFTKKDFGALEQFYSKSWDRLSESGKDEMSHRFWEGIRRGEYKFKDAPEVMQKKQAERAYQRLEHASRSMGGAELIPESDRRDFMRSYEAGKYDEANRILDRDSFKWNMSRERTPGAVLQVDFKTEQQADAQRIAAASSQSQPADDVKTAQKIDAKTNNDIRNIDLTGLKLADASEQVSSATIPKAAGAEKSGPSLGG